MSGFDFIVTFLYTYSTWMKVNGLERAYFWAGPAVVIIVSYHMIR